MSSENENNFIYKTFLLLANFVTEKNYDLYINVSIKDNNILIVNEEEDIYYKWGQVLAFFYILNINHLNKEEVQYDEKKGSINLAVNGIIYEHFKNETKSEEIIDYMINKSTYNKSILPSNIRIKKKELFRLKEGFKTTYQIFMDEKINLVNFLESCEISNQYLELKRNLMLLNPNDLNIQLYFIELKVSGKAITNSMIKRLVSCRENYDMFIETSKDVSDLLIKSSVIGLNNDSTELMWIGYYDKKIEPIGYRNVYIAIFFAYIGKMTSKECYKHVVEQSINPVLTDIKSIKDKNIISNVEYYNVLQLLYLLNIYIECNELNKFIEKNNKLFSLIKLSDKIKCKVNTTDLILKNIYDKSLDVMVSLVL